MTHITLGHSGRKPVYLDLAILIRTRLLVTANSGGGKSWLLRRLAEQLYGKVQVILIDPEGEFPSLREKYGYVLVGKGGYAFEQAIPAVVGGTQGEAREDSRPASQ